MISRLRDALENSNGLLEELALVGEWGESARAQISENKIALAEPLRNCDVGTAEEQMRRWWEFCKMRDSCDECLCHKKSCIITLCFAHWAQMPYKKGEEK